jgi:hypothetical protein
MAGQVSSEMVDIRHRVYCPVTARRRTWRGPTAGEKTAGPAPIRVGVMDR